MAGIMTVAATATDVGCTVATLHAVVNDPVPGSQYVFQVNPPGPAGFQDIGTATTAQSGGPNPLLIDQKVHGLDQNSAYLYRIVEYTFGVQSDVGNNDGVFITEECYNYCGRLYSIDNSEQVLLRDGDADGVYLHPLDELDVLE